MRGFRSSKREENVKLYWSSRSPYARLVMVTAFEVGLGEKIECYRTVVDITKPHPELHQVNPLCKIPTLVIEDGTPIYDSRVICEYLDERQGRKLLPAEGPERLTQLRRVALGHGLIDLLLSWLLERNRPQEKQEPAVIGAIKIKYDKVLDALEALAPALAGEPFRMGHVFIGTALSYSDFRFAAVDWRSGRGALAAWHETFVARPSYQADPFFDEIAAAAAAAKAEAEKAKA
jgi:glutathione S-transferase